MWKWHCPKDGLEHYYLAIAGWRVLHTLKVDDQPWVCLCKPRDCADLSFKLN